MNLLPALVAVSRKEYAEEHQKDDFKYGYVKCHCHSAHVVPVERRLNTRTNRLEWFAYCEQTGDTYVLDEKELALWRPNHAVIVSLIG